MLVVLHVRCCHGTSGISIGTDKAGRRLIGRHLMQLITCACMGSLRALSSKTWLDDALAAICSLCFWDRLPEPAKTTTL